MVHSVPEAGGGDGGSGEEGAVSRSVSAGGRVDGDRGGVMRGMSGVLQRSERTVLLPRHPATPGVPGATDGAGQSVGAGGGELSHEPRRGAESHIWRQAKVMRVRASDGEVSERVREPLRATPVHPERADYADERVAGVCGPVRGCVFHAVSPASGVIGGGITIPTERRESSCSALP